MTVTQARSTPLSGRGRQPLLLPFAGLALIFLLLPLLASAPLVDPDEGLHAAIAQEMVLRHDFVTPTFLGTPFLDKPILFFWTEAASLQTFGMNETAVRTPPLLFGLLGMLTVAWLARTLIGGEAALVAGIVYASMVLPLGVSEVAVHDVALVPFVCVSVLCLWRAAGSPRSWMWGLPIGLSLGLSILTKGLVGPAFAGLFAVCLVYVRRDAFGKVAVALLAAAPLMVTIAAPWYLAMEHGHPGYLHYYFMERHVEAYLTATQRHSGRSWWYYVPIMIAGPLPWTGYLVGALRQTKREETVRIILWSWCAIGLVFLSVAESKLVTYVLPLFPAIAVLIADVITTAWRATDLAGAATRRGRLAAAGASAVLVLAALPALMTFAAQERYHMTSGAAWIMAAGAAPIVLAVSWNAWRATSLDRFMGRMSIAIVVSFAVLAGALGPRVARWMTARDVAIALNASRTLPPSVSVVEERIGSLVFYLSPDLRAQATADRLKTMNRSTAIEQLRQESPESVVAVRDDELPRFQQLFQRPPEPMMRAGTFTIFRVGALVASLADPQ
jgi:4-amino-4-deoxy-L-arabinose transferase-like glycosyltransferase